jgi:NitT/TauT family transport system permease protein
VAALKPSHKNLRWWQLGVLVAVLLAAGSWCRVTCNTRYFLGEPVKVAGRIWSWFMPFGFGPSALFPDGLPGRPTSTCTWA